MLGNKKKLYSEFILTCTNNYITQNIKRVGENKSRVLANNEIRAVPQRKFVREMRMLKFNKVDIKSKRYNVIS